MLQASAIKEFQLLMEASYEMITEIAVEEVDPDQYVMVADGITAKKTEDRMVPEKMTVMWVVYS